MYVIELEHLEPDKLIKVIKVLKGLTTDELANEVGLGYATVSKVESGQGKAGAKFLNSFSTHYNLEFGVLMLTARIYNKKFEKLN